jgi:hypothetical protein
MVACFEEPLLDEIALYGSYSLSWKNGGIGYCLRYTIQCDDNGIYILIYLEEA